MEKLGVERGHLITGLRQEEARLMQRMQEVVSQPGEKTAEDHEKLETELQDVRQRITEFDLQGENS